MVVNVGRRHAIPGSERKDFITYSSSGNESIIIFMLARRVVTSIGQGKEDR